MCKTLVREGIVWMREEEQGFQKRFLFLFDRILLITDCVNVRSETRDERHVRCERGRYAGEKETRATACAFSMALIGEGDFVSAYSLCAGA